MIQNEAYPLPGCQICSNESDEFVEHVNGQYPPKHDGTPPTLAIGILAVGFHCLGALHVRNHPMTLMTYGRSMPREREG